MFRLSLVLRWAVSGKGHTVLQVHPGHGLYNLVQGNWPKMTFFIDIHCITFPAPPEISPSKMSFDIAIAYTVHIGYKDYVDFSLHSQKSPQVMYLMISPILRTLPIAYCLLCGFRGVSPSLDYMSNWLLTALHIQLPLLFTESSSCHAWWCKNVRSESKDGVFILGINGLAVGTVASPVDEKKH